MARKQRKLRKGEKRIEVGFEKKSLKIVKPKNYNSWKTDKNYNRKLKRWLPDRDYQFSKGRYKNYDHEEFINTANLVLKSKAKKRTKREVQREITKEERFRKQACINYINRGADKTGLIFLSIRAITINPDVNYDGLIQACRQAQAILVETANIVLSDYKSYDAGELPTRLGTGEDTRLNNYKIWIELFYEGKVIKTFSLK